MGCDGWFCLGGSVPHTHTHGRTICCVVSKAKRNEWTRRCNLSASVRRPRSANSHPNYRTDYRDQQQKDKRTKGRVRQSAPGLSKHHSSNKSNKSNKSNNGAKSPTDTAEPDDTQDTPPNQLNSLLLLCAFSTAE